MINVSIVLYHTPITEVQQVVRQLKQSRHIDRIWLIDNSEIQTEAFMFLGCDYIFNGNNLGYGAGHNIAIKKSLATEAEYHLVMNSDVCLSDNTIDILLEYMDTHRDTGQCMPLIKYKNGSIQYLAKLLPTPYDLFIRRFVPKRLTRKRTGYFELQNAPFDRPLNIPFLSGCFMFLRTQALREVGLFDERFFMYSEDIDLTRRIHRKYKTILLPNVEVIHGHSRGSYHQIKLLLVHIKSTCKYFNKWGWIFDRERKRFNEETLKQISSR